MKVLWIFRQPAQGVFSIENLFGSLEPEMRKNVDLSIPIRNHQNFHYYSES